MRPVLQVDLLNHMQKQVGRESKNLLLSQPEPLVTGVTTRAVFSDRFTSGSGDLVLFHFQSLVRLLPHRNSSRFNYPKGMFA